MSDLVPKRLPGFEFYACCALLTALVALPAGAALDPLKQGTEDHEAQVLGWSADGQRFAVRLYVLEPFIPRPAVGEVPRCEGYGNHEGHTLRGGLVLLAYERSRLLATFPILDRDRCTPPDEADQRFEAAKKKLDALGIRLGNTGQELKPIGNSVTIEQGPQAPYTLEYEERATPDAAASKSGTQRGTLEQGLSVSRSGSRQKVFSRTFAYAYSTATAGYFRTGLDRVWLSPSGTTLVVLSYERVGNISGGRKSLRLLSVLDGSGGSLKPL